MSQFPILNRSALIVRPKEPIEGIPRKGEGVKQFQEGNVPSSQTRHSDYLVPDSNLLPRLPFNLFMVLTFFLCATACSKDQENGRYQIVSCGERGSGNLNLNWLAWHTCMLDTRNGLLYISNRPPTIDGLMAAEEASSDNRVYSWTPYVTLKDTEKKVANLKTSSR